MPIPASSGIRRKITLAFATACATIIAFTAVVIQFLLQMLIVECAVRHQPGEIARFRSTPSS
jgi:hypothetical protein